MAHGRNGAGLALILVCLFAVSGMAQGKGAKTVEEALKDIRPAGGICSKDDIPPSVAELTGRNADLPDLSCALSPAEARELAGASETVVVDTRTAGEFAGFHIGGALNMGARDVRVKSFLAGKPILLVGNGKGERELYVVCSELKRAGFRQVRVLKGGMPGWLADHHPVIGLAEPAAVLVNLSPAQLWSESRFDSNLVLLTPGMAQFQKEFPKAQVVREINIESIKGILDKRSRDRKAPPVSSIVLVAGNELKRDAIDGLVQGVKTAPLLVYSDSPESLRQHIASLEAVWRAQARGPRQPKCGV